MIRWFEAEVEHAGYQGKDKRGCRYDVEDVGNDDEGEGGDTEQTWDAKVKSLGCVGEAYKIDRRPLHRRRP